MTAYFQSGYRFTSNALPGPGRRAPLPSLDGALGHHLDDGRALDLDLDAARDLDADEGVAHLRDLAEHAARSHDLVALGERVDHGLVLLLPLHLRPDHDEVEHHEHEHQRQHAA